VSVIWTTVLNLEGNITLNINRILGKNVKGTIKIETTLLFHDDIFFDNIVFLTIAVYLEQKYFFSKLSFTWIWGEMQSKSWNIRKRSIKRCTPF